MKKPTGRRQGHRKHPEIALVAHAEPAAIPEAPQGLLRATLDLWDIFWSSSVAKIVAGVDRPAINRLFSLYDERERALRSFKRQRLTRGSKKQPVLNPFARSIPVMDAEIGRLEDRLGCSPRARLALGITTEEEDDLSTMAAGCNDDADDARQDPRRFLARS